VRLLLAVALALAASAGCASNQPAAQPSKSTRPEASPLHDGPLTDFVPSAGLRWMVVGRPRELATDPSLGPALALLLPKERLDAYAQASGMDVRALPSGLIAGFDHATLYVAEERSDGLKALERFSERLVAGTKVASPHPKIHRLSGVIGQTPETLVRIDGRLIAISVGSSLPARITQLYALEKLTKSPAVLHGSALRTLPIRELESAPMRFYAPGPFSGEWTSGARGLLATATAVGIAARPAAEGKVAVTVILSGSFGGEGDASTTVLAAWKDLAESGLGRLLGLDQAVAPSVVASPDSLRLNVEVLAMPLAQGLRAAVMAEVWEFLDLKGENSAPAPTP